MARRNKRASMREGPLADLFRSTSDDAPVDPPEAPRYGRLDPAEAKKAEEEAPAVEEPQAEESPAPTEPEPELEPAPFVSEQPAESSETAPERLKRVFSEEPKPRRGEEFVPQNPRYGREEPAYEPPGSGEPHQPVSPSTFTNVEVLPGMGTTGGVSMTVPPGEGVGVVVGGAVESGVVTATVGLATTTGAGAVGEPPPQRLTATELPSRRATPIAGRRLKVMNWRSYPKGLDVRQDPRVIIVYRAKLKCNTAVTSRSRVPGGPGCGLAAGTNDR